MTYEVTLINADIRDPMDGEMRLGLTYDGKTVCEVAYKWDDARFSAVFHGHAPTLPVPAHPATLIERPIAAIQAVRSEKHTRPSDVFADHRVFISLNTKD
ncbi:hypothetical protein [uncultured Litoreibacter sp.]|uniref:hypothetical protein n=1 Tax=uncultured Litoreibacter sp. TaxID=1392394 RepID=UPI00263376B4|nr:hypothetical protein [uncultured Litoreibacter sp.]